MANFPRQAYLFSTSTSPTAFLYQTRTLWPVSRSVLTRGRSQYQYSTDEQAVKDDQISTNNSSLAQGSPSNADPLQEKVTKSSPSRTSYLRRRGRTAPASYPTNDKPWSRDSGTKKSKSRTFTRNERDAFDGLLSRWNKQQTDHAQTEESETITHFESILGTTTHGASQKHGSESKRKETPIKDRDKPRDEEEGIHLSELGFTTPGSRTTVDPIVPMKAAIHMVVQRELRKIEAELFQAMEDQKSDSAVWKVCKERIFTIPDHVGGATSSSSSDLDGVPNEHQVDQSNSGEVFSGPLNIPAAVPAGLVVAKLYPRLLVVAFRVLSTHFPESPLIGQFRTAVRANGRTSAFLGTSSQLYEELMTFSWYTCNDLPAVVSSLQDMEIAGLDTNRRVRKLLRDIVDQREHDLDSPDQVRDRSFWDAPPNQQAFEELAGPGGWLETISSRMKQQKHSTMPVLKL
ncbi:uncharacterized protein N7483_001525 [Penicillium malachiteum]|uniref:uncharacterized protein n=1 Tax=Penicillium malachiteum TaxID=1324776 RepID=UPI002547C492|nr:uncharacterized protein N7483_001525 [Penicillium malachiteum]KAJ5736400.1 hypothetical protein N7483_001525 [Penicillium malachiteum]